MNITLYHGSEYIIDKPDLRKGKPNNDFGSGFYCTQDYNLAGEWACKNGKPGFINSYTLTTENLKELNLLSPSYNVLHWIALLLNYRTFDTSSEIASRGKKYLLSNYLINREEYDLIQSFRADDSYFGYAQSFLNNSISIQQLNKAMRLGNLGKQFVIVSAKGFANLNFQTADKADSLVYYKSFIQRDKKAREDFKTMVNDDIENGIYLLDIIRGNVNDTCLR